MGTRIITSPTPAERERWERFVFEHPKGNIFQTPYMYDVFKGTKDHDPQVILIMEDDTVVGSLLSVIQQFKRGPLRPFSTRSAIWGGIIAKDNSEQRLEILLDAYDEQIKAAQPIYTQMRFVSMPDTDITRIMARHGYLQENELNILIDLSQDQTTLWRALSKSRRKEIRLARENGVEMTQATDAESLQDGYRILHDVLNRADAFIPDESIFQAAWENSRKDHGLKLFLTRHNETIIAINYLLTYKDREYAWFGGAIKEHQAKFPNQLSDWELILWGKEKGYALFDYGGAGSPHIPYGPREYKKQFGGTQINLHRYKKIHHPLRMGIATAGYNALKHLKKKG